MPFNINVKKKHFLCFLNVSYHITKYAFMPQYVESKKIMFLGIEWSLYLFIFILIQYTSISYSSRNKLYNFFFLVLFFFFETNKKKNHLILILNLNIKDFYRSFFSFFYHLKLSASIWGLNFCQTYVHSFEMN